MKRKAQKIHPSGLLVKYRKVRRLNGRSFYVNVPRQWVEINELEPEDKVVLICESHTIRILAPEKQSTTTLQHLRKKK